MKEPTHLRGTNVSPRAAFAIYRGTCYAVLMLKKIGMAVLGAACVVYLINPTLGVFEIIPDNLPIS